MDTYDESQYTDIIPSFALDDMWASMTPAEQVDVIIQTMPQEQWFDDVYLPILASFRHDPVRWGRIKAQYRHIGGSPYDLERAADALNPATTRPTTLIPVDPGHTLTAVVQTMPQLAKKLTREMSWDDEEHANADVLAMGLFLENGWTEDEVIQLVKTLHEDVRHPVPSYDDLQIRLSQAYARIQGITEVDNPDEAMAMAARAKSRTLANLAGFFRIPCARVIRHGTENALWHLRMADGRDIRLGTSEDLDNPKKVRTAIFDATGVRMTRLAAKDAQKWDEVLEMMHQVAEVIDTPELTRKGKIMALLHGYVEIKNLNLAIDMDEEEVDAYLLDNRPFVHDGALVFPLSSLYLDYVKGFDGSLSQATIMDMLREIGGERIVRNVREGNARYFRRLWKIPASIFHHDDASLERDAQASPILEL